MITLLILLNQRGGKRRPVPHHAGAVFRQIDRFGGRADQRLGRIGDLLEAGELGKRARGHWRQTLGELDVQVRVPHLLRLHHELCGRRARQPQAHPPHLEVEPLERLVADGLLMV